MPASNATAAPASLSKCARMRRQSAIVRIRVRKRLAHRGFVERARALFEARRRHRGGSRAAPAARGPRKTRRSSARQAAPDAASNASRAARPARAPSSRAPASAARAALLRGTPASAAASAAMIRSRISPAALRVNVIATMRSGRSTRRAARGSAGSGARSFPSPPAPGPGTSASTSSARARAAASASTSASIRHRPPDSRIVSARDPRWRGRRSGTAPAAAMLARRLFVARRDRCRAGGDLGGEAAEDLGPTRFQSRPNRRCPSTIEPRRKSEARPCAAHPRRGRGRRPCPVSIARTQPRARRAAPRGALRQRIESELRRRRPRIEPCDPAPSVDPSCNR